MKFVVQTVQMKSEKFHLNENHQRKTMKMAILAVVWPKDMTYYGHRLRCHTQECQSSNRPNSMQAYGLPEEGTHRTIE